ncbi:hypothetical protein HPB47_019891 [Ixodes persulcatus]|uniref:Uncharacterized protein n=1 Tax=Ixodes persulcatus TaxID=34615 RepID=A0AC60QHT2_IXOPE|nr:hypothetical protein HPB47_019891 [Ixodes persulcatus]
MRAQCFPVGCSLGRSPVQLAEVSWQALQGGVRRPHRALGLGKSWRPGGDEDAMHDEYDPLLRNAAPEPQFGGPDPYRKCLLGAILVGLAVLLAILVALGFVWGGVLDKQRSTAPRHKVQSDNTPGTAAPTPLLDPRSKEAQRPYAAIV